MPQKHRAFAFEYVKCFDRFAAADSAGVPRGSSLAILRDPLVTEFIKYLNEKKEHISLIDAAFIEVQYLSVLGKLLGEEEVPMVDKDGCSFKAKKFHASESVSALRDMAKVAGLYKDDGLGNVNVNVNLGSIKLTDQQKEILDQALDGKY